jgi:replicative DNA helicase
MTDELPLLGPSQWLEAIEENGEAVPLPGPFPGLLEPPTRGRAAFLGGPTGGGKTALALQTFRTVLDGGYSGAFITLEMTPADLFMRFSRQFDSKEHCRQWIQNTNAFVSESYVDAHEVEQIIKQGFDFVVVDHVHELDYEDRRELERKITRIARLAPSTDTALLILCQLRRPDPAFPRPPSKHDFRETGRIEQLASVLLALYQEDEHSDEHELYCLKSRFGPRHAPLALKLNRNTVVFEKAEEWRP